MTLADLRKLAIRQQTKIRFPLAGGLECVVSEQGIARVPGLTGTPDFNLEQELTSAQIFHLDTRSADPKGASTTRLVRREELAALTGGNPTVETHEHEDE